ncbi:annexin D2-like isoform X2 [Vitis riparia]|uniref:annexin D2-like isoform X2 n=1 Tax=Vitis riparia TaxID=96939 RepID=UPI00155B1A2E|nr:annexin D2-like isoform X2 [Vitis riparia]XP_034696770.1 annexin D2-like isoform X2 [Vitis riparia]
MSPNRAAEDCEQLRKAFACMLSSSFPNRNEGWGINEALIISILPHTNEAQGGLIVEVGALSLSIEILQNKRLNIR